MMWAPPEANSVRPPQWNALGVLKQPGLRVTM